MSCLCLIIAGSLAYLAASLRSASTNPLPSLESSPEQGIHLPGGTCDWNDGVPWSSKGNCDLTILPASNLMHVRAGRGNTFLEHLVVIRAQTLRRPRKSWNGAMEIGFRLPGHTRDLVFSTSPDSEANEYFEAFDAIVNALPVVLREPDSAKIIQVNLSATCHRTTPGSAFMAAQPGVLELRWKNSYHHLTVGIAGSEEIRKPFWGALDDSEDVKIDDSELPDVVAADAPPQSCFFLEDSEQTADCLMYEPHVSELRNLLQCLDLPSSTSKQQLAVADFLRRLVFVLRVPRTPREVAVAATMAAFTASVGFRDDEGLKEPLRFPFPSKAAQCLGLGEDGAKAFPRIQALGCSLPLASATGFGMMHSGIMDETPFDRRYSIRKAAMLAGGYRRVAGDEEEKKYGHTALVYPAENPDTVRVSGIETIATLQAPPICLRVVVEKLRSITFMTYDKYAWFGDPAKPFESLSVPSIEACVSGSNGNFGSNCRYYVGCVIQLLQNFDRIPGISSELVTVCSSGGRKLELIDNKWMQEDNSYWMTGVGSRVFSFLKALSGGRLCCSGRSRSKRVGDKDEDLAAGDVVRIERPGFVEDGQLHEVVRVDASGKVCLKRGDRPTGCWPVENLQLVPENEWTIEPSTGIPIDA